jgi:tetratricopeptide (TPR) repeat protein
MAQTTLHDYLQETEDAISAGRLDAAFAHCQRILTQFPESLEAQRLLGEVYLAQNQLEEARQSFDWVLTNDPENVLVYCNRALVCEKMSDVDTALDCYQQAYELSHGNGQIRQQFNQLSTKAGQQAFMFSRAGLARLYMRGDLLSQAILEWEAVLAVTPDRLDARLGLLETYWHAGNDEKVEQLANQITQDVPGCLKALLLLAYVLAPKNGQKVQEVLRRAQALDPEMLMAQELFADAMARQPSHPFFLLWKKTPVMIELTDEAEVKLPPTEASSLKVQTPSPSAPEWSHFENWGSVGALMQQRQEQQVSPEIPALVGWRDAQTSSSSPERSPSLPTSQGEENVTKTPAPVQPSTPEPSWEAQDTLAEARWWENTRNEEEEQEKPLDTYSWASSLQEDEGASPPSWLSLLTQGEHSQEQETTPTAPHTGAAPVSPQKTQEPMKPSALTPPVPESIPSVPDEPASQAFQWNADQPAEASSAEDSEESFFFGPEWLRALGATNMDTPASDEGTPSVPLASPPLVASEEQSETMVPDGALPQQHEADRYEIQEKSAEQNVLTTLENLEQELHAQGFVHLEPNSLSSIAQSQETTLIAQEQASSVPEARTEDVRQETSLSSALAQLGPFSSPDVTPPIPTIPTTPAQPAQGATKPEPLIQAPPVSKPIPAEPTRVPAARSETPLDSELETTMKRPAVRLQAMQQRATRGPSQASAASLIGKGHRSERTTGVLQNGTADYREHLLRGYQHQLVGDYDEAMQEYRLIIRSAPELLADVISNIRALLKLAPKYSVGYRVLGDAYMRQGEYLQAMEAYNKALTMAKKVRG